MLAVLFALGNGHQRGLWLSLFQYAGLLLGVLAGAALVPGVIALLGLPAQGPARSLVGVVLLVVAGSVGSSLGFWAGEPIRRRILDHPGRSELDSSGGAIFSAFAVVAVAWFLGLSLSRVPNPVVAGLIQRSAILRLLDGIAPRPPGFLAGAEKVIAGVPFPATFSGLEPTFGSPAPLPASIDTPGVNRAAASTVKIQGLAVGCSGVIAGSGFPVSPQHVLTNAHVVAGTRDNVIIDARGARYPARVVLFDPQTDVAVLYAPNYNVAPLATAAAARGVQGAVIGYPGGGPETSSAAAVDEQITAEGRDIYNQGLVTRQVLVVDARVEPGNSGGPLVDLEGRRIGVVFAASTSDPSRAYALTDGQVQPDIDAGGGRTQAVPVGDQCAV